MSEHRWDRARSPFQPNLSAFQQSLPLILLLNSIIWMSAPSLCVSSSPITRGIRAALLHWHRHVPGEAAPSTHTPCQPELPQKPRAGCSARRLGQGVAVTLSCDLGFSFLPTHGDTLLPLTETPCLLPGSIAAALQSSLAAHPGTVFPAKHRALTDPTGMRQGTSFVKPLKGKKNYIYIFYRPIFCTDRQLFESQSAL